MSDKNNNDHPCPQGPELCPIYNEVNELQLQLDRLNSEVRTDELTTLFNSRHFWNTLEQEIERTLRSGQPTTLIMLDVDHFKRFNDSYGHVAGDEALRHLATLIKHSTRRLDIPCRYGGEEFAIILPSTPLLIATQVAERLRESIERSAIEWQGKTLQITASLGVDTFHNHQPESSQSFVERVDNHLYRAKTTGRNQVCHGRSSRETVVEVSSAEKKALWEGLREQQDNSDSAQDSLQVPDDISSNRQP
ncbi:GGDEF domain-containing protein [Teredinibacter waterburyi]|uniref:GGDEF domain-containing protein n=1 Tax=Teredinibacter waterburyi TaxID=1500538 RepID=UPI00165FF667|nr:GGDEF domain-containing protein [Teredinibacter waterburyi]